MIAGRHVHQEANAVRETVAIDNVRCPECGGLLGRVPREGRALIECKRCRHWVVWPRLAMRELKAAAVKLGRDICKGEWT